MQQLRPKLKKTNSCEFAPSCVEKVKFKSPTKDDIKTRYQEWKRTAQRFSRICSQIC